MGLPKKSNPRVEVPGTMTNFAVRITLPFFDLSGALRAWALKADTILVYEHLGGKTEKVHIHALLMGCNATDETLKNIIKSHGITHLSGNGDWSFKTKHKELGPLTDATKDGFVTYMSKGQLMPLYNKGFTDDYLMEMRDRWVDPKEYGSKDERSYDEFAKTCTVEQLRGELQQWRDNLMRLSRTADIFSKTETDVLVQRVRSWSFTKHKRIWNVQTARVAKMVILTYCMRNNLELPKDIKVFS